MDLTEEIKQEYEQVNRFDRHKVIKEISLHVPAKPQSIQKNWMCDSSFWSIPEKYQKTVLTILQNWVKQQNKVEV